MPGHFFMSQHRKMQSQSTSARVQMYSARDWLAYFCAHLHELCWLKCVCVCVCVCLCVCASENCITSQHRTHVCVYSFSVCTVMTRRSDGCCEHKPEPLEDRPATQAEKHALCTRDKPLHHFTSAAVGSADCPLPPPRILATAERPPGNASVIVTAFPSNDTAPFQIHEMGHRKKNTVHHQILSSASQMSLETRSCFITIRLQSSSPLLSLGIWEHCPYAPLTPAAGWGCFFFLSFFFFQEKTGTESEHSWYNAKIQHVLQCQHVIRRHFDQQ